MSGGGMGWDEDEGVGVGATCSVVDGLWMMQVGCRKIKSVEVLSDNVKPFAALKEMGVS
jgi:hypothetical protein